MIKVTMGAADGEIGKMSLEGTIDIAGAAEIEQPFSILSGSRRCVVVDFTRVDFLASLGVRVLVQSARALGSRGGRLILVGAAEPVRRVLVACGVDTIVDLVDSEADAMMVARR